MKLGQCDNETFSQTDREPIATKRLNRQNPTRSLLERKLHLMIERKLHLMSLSLLSVLRDHDFKYVAR